MIRKCIQTITAIAAAAATVVMSAVAYTGATLPDQYYVNVQNKVLTVDTALGSVTGEASQAEEGARTAVSTGGNAASVELKLFGIIPVKSAYVKQVEEVYLVPCGTAFGVKMLTKGVMVVGLNDITTDDGNICPAKQAGIRTGDVIASINGQAVNSNDDVAALVNQAGGAAVTVNYVREEKTHSVQVQPVRSNIDGNYKTGMWVRDSTAGIGTVTFYEASTGNFGGLGHAITDIDTGEILPLNSGEVVEVDIYDIVKGISGIPGELCGTFTSSNACGQITTNNGTGIFGFLDACPTSATAVPIAYKQEIEEGPATIYTTIDGTGPKEYQIEIENVDMTSNSPTKNMVLRVTDETLLAATGGIVQGMSGSPIMQNGKIVGAVTHVFVNDPAQGYGIFIENMYENVASNH